MPFTSAAFEHALMALERAEAGRSGQPLGETTFARVSLARRMASAASRTACDPAAQSRGPSLLFQR